MLIKSKKSLKHQTVKKTEFPKLETNKRFNKDFSIYYNDGTTKYTAQEAIANADYEKELQEIKEISFKEGFEKGESVGYEKGLQVSQPYVDKFSELINEVQVQQEEVIAESEKFIINFALRIVEIITGSEEIGNLVINEKKLQSIVEEALNQFPESTKYILRVHKDTSEFLEPFKAQIIENLSRPAALSIMEDPSIKPGECLIESEHGVIDARIDSQLEEIKNVFVKKDDRDSNE